MFRPISFIHSKALLPRLYTVQLNRSFCQKMTEEEEEAREYQYPKHYLFMAEKHLKEGDAAQSCEKIFQSAKCALSIYVNELAEKHGFKQIPRDQWDYAKYRKLCTHIRENCFSDAKEGKAFKEKFHYFFDTFHLRGWNCIEFERGQVKEGIEDAREFAEKVRQLPKEYKLAKLISKEFFEFDAEYQAEKVLEVEEAREYKYPKHYLFMAEKHLNEGDAAQSCEKIFQSAKCALYNYANELTEKHGFKQIPRDQWDYAKYRKLCTHIRENCFSDAKEGKEFSKDWETFFDTFHLRGWNCIQSDRERVKEGIEDAREFAEKVRQLPKEYKLAKLISKEFFEFDAEYQAEKVVEVENLAKGSTGIAADYYRRHGGKDISNEKRREVRQMCFQKIGEKVMSSDISSDQIHLKISKLDKMENGDTFERMMRQYKIKTNTEDGWKN